MTGFARQEGRDETCSWVWEARSVNGRGLDIRCRLPVGFEGLEQPARERASRRFRRGNVQLSLAVTRAAGSGVFRINPAALEQAIALVPEVRRRLPDAQPPTVDGLLALKGVIEAVEAEPSAPEREAREAKMLGDLDTALTALAAMRAEEGERLAKVVRDHLNTLAGLRAEAEKQAAAQPAAILERLKTQVAALVEAVPALPADRLAQEAALLVAKADLREELDRLKAHDAAARDLIASGEGIGRKLDFLCQEFNREANTLCSKSTDVALTRVGLDLKAVIEQIREQVQNIE
jgi:uncharacterized protein (TIGR00255 family)